MNRVSHAIVFVAINARYSHPSYALRTLAANLGSSLVSDAVLIENDLTITPRELAESILAHQPRVVFFSVYLWSRAVAEATAQIIRRVAPSVVLAVGGPEITEVYTNSVVFDTVMIGEGETAVRGVASAVLEGRVPPARIVSEPEDLVTLALPYDAWYTDEDLARRTVYVESSRGCPGRCAYCTAASTGLRLFPLEKLLPAFDRLWRRGQRTFKFLDRSFNAPVDHACAILDFFRERATPDMRLHFEIDADRLHPRVAVALTEFPADALHLEVGIQTLNPVVAMRINRMRDVESTLETLSFLMHKTGAVVHADLIFGLPGEDEASFRAGFNRLVTQFDPPELQVNLLKLLPGTQLAREAATHGIVANPEPPYDVLATDAMDFATLARLRAFARCWEIVHNRGVFPEAVAALAERAQGDVYGVYTALTERIATAEGRMFAIHRTRLRALIDEFLETP